MKVYCMNDRCPNKSKGYAICTTLMSLAECPMRITETASNTKTNKNTR